MTQSPDFSHLTILDPRCKIFGAYLHLLRTHNLFYYQHQHITRQRFFTDQELIDAIPPDTQYSLEDMRKAEKYYNVIHSVWGRIRMEQFRAQGMHAGKYVIALLFEVLELP